MSYLPDLSDRSSELELMDAPDSCPQQLCRTLEHFDTINRWLTPCRRLLKHYFLAQMALDRSRNWSLLDLGAGGCDLAIWFTQLCQQRSITLKVTCLDNDPRVVNFAETRCGGLPNIEIVKSDALALGADRQWDFVFANHFLHHLRNDEILTVLERVAEIARYRFVLSDIRRTYSNYFGYTALAAIWFRDGFAYYDGRLSIRKGFTLAECARLIEAAGLSGRAEVKRWFPAHLVFASR